MTRQEIKHVSGFSDYKSSTSCTQFSELMNTVLTDMVIGWEKQRFSHHIYAASFHGSSAHFQEVS